jgi:hypothetical protein
VPVAVVQLERVEGTLAGVVGDQRVDLVLDVPNSRAGIRGTSLGGRLDGYWHIESNYNNLAPVGIFLGEYDGSPVFLRNEVHLTPRYALTHADVSGAIGEQELRARVAAVEAPAYGPSVWGVDGNFGDTTITLFVAVASDLSGARLDGVIGGVPIKLDATHTSVTGEYAGPPALFPLLLCSPLYFF